MKKLILLLISLCMLFSLFCVPANAESAMSEHTEDYTIEKTITPEPASLRLLLTWHFDDIFERVGIFDQNMAVTVGQVQKTIALLDTGKDGWEMTWNDETYNSYISQMSYFDDIGSISFETKQYMTIDQMLAVAVRICGGEKKVMELNEKTSPSY